MEWFRSWLFYIWKPSRIWTTSNTFRPPKYTSISQDIEQQFLNLHKIYVHYTPLYFGDFGTSGMNPGTYVLKNLW